MVSATLLVGTLVLATATVSAVQLAEREPTWYVDDNGNKCYYMEDTDRPGNDVGNKPAKDFHECDRICMDFDGCATWSWSNHNGGTCWLKSRAGDSIVIVPGMMSITCNVPKKQEVNTCYPYYEIDFVGNDIGSKRGRVAECCTICDRTTGCKAYAWNQDNGGTCYLKSSVGDAVYKPGVTSASTQGNLGPLCPFMYDTNFGVNDIGNKPAKDAGVCCSQCKENKACRAFTWSNYNGGTCWMKSGRGMETKMPGVVSGVIQN